MSLAFRSGFMALLGRPNVGKSTLLNRLVGEKIAIVSPKPQTTRNRIVGVLTEERGQVAFVDTPGIHSAKGLLNRLMVDVALKATSEVDLIGLVTEPPRKWAKPDIDVPFPPGEDEILKRLEISKKPVILVINKIDLISKPLLLPAIARYRQRFPFKEIVPLSAKSGEGVETLVTSVFRHLGVGEAMFDKDMLTDQTERAIAAELIREQVILKTHQELPYATAVVVEEFDESERVPRKPKSNRGGLGGLLRIAAVISVERDSQKSIVIGKRGQMLKAIGTAARKSLEKFFGSHVYLSLQVTLDPGWTERRESLRNLGYQ